MASAANEGPAFREDVSTPDEERVQPVPACTTRRASALVPGVPDLHRKAASSSDPGGGFPGPPPPYDDGSMSAATASSSSGGATSSSKEPGTCYRETSVRDGETLQEDKPALFAPGALAELRSALEASHDRGHRMQLHGALSLREDLSAVQGNTHRGYEVVLHVYDLGPVTSYVNDTVLRHIGIGAYHTGLEVLGVEWSYQGFLDAWDNPNLSGVVQNEPREHPAHQYRESIPMGESPMTEDEIDNIIDDFYDMWAANEYHIVSRNCVTFAEELAVALKVPQEFPSWVKGAAEAGKSPGLFHV